MNTPTNTNKRAAYIVRDRILNLLTDAEVASVSTSETEPSLVEGEEYVDLEELDRGVRRAAADAPPMGRVLPRKAVHDSTWQRIVRELDDIDVATPRYGM